MGEFNIWYNRKLWLTKDIDIAIIFWSLNIIEKCNATFVTQERKYRFDKLRNLIRQWHDEGKNLASKIKNIDNKYLSRSINESSDNEDDITDDDEIDDILEDQLDDNVIIDEVGFDIAQLRTDEKKI
jgi:hypothetical protein